MVGERVRAGVAQLVEYELPKLGVAGSNPVARSIIRDAPEPERLYCSASRAGFSPPGVAKRPRSVSGGEFISPPRNTRAGLGGAPLAPQRHGCERSGIHSRERAGSRVRC